ncbi:hypothetical protein DICVIV_02896 [Dictyocaulus viviparus]|uniref:RRP15-like protein n=1 Tax=Dictyocaulus viviparus TaxID=29172 RepID=A0A0D8Y2K5_DICVI|nr:hypothetical protein DICVIV_02896 [Dictyocaulus viviparus]
MSMTTNGDVLEICEESDVDHQECEDSDDDNELRVVPEMSDTVSFPSQPSKSPQRKRRRIKKLTRSQLCEKRKLALERKLFGLTKPDSATDKEKERLLRSIATKGVVQLFNAVAERQRVLAEELSKKMTAKERKEAERRLHGSNFRVYSEANSVGKTEPKDSDEEMSVKKEEDD